MSAKLLASIAGMSSRHLSALIITPLGLWIWEAMAVTIFDLGDNLNFLSSYLERPNSLPWVPQCDIVRFSVALPTPHDFKTRHTKLSWNSTFKPSGSLSPFDVGSGYYKPTSFYLVRPQTTPTGGVPL
ncbi:hypothetical protein ACLOJK_003837 [Asimina triloba]